MSFLSFCKNSRGPAYRQAGFTLVEMMVVVTIFVIITGVVLANLPEFRDKSSLELVAEEVALTIRQAQVYGVGVRASSTKFPAFGVKFNTGTADEFILFADVSNVPNNHFDPNGTCGQLGSECLEQLVIGGGSSKIGKVFGCGGGRGCSEDKGANLANIDVNILFQRPESEAHFFGANGNALEESPGVPLSNIAIVIQSTRNTNNKRVIHVWKTGHIYVDRT